MNMINMKPSYIRCLPFREPLLRILKTAGASFCFIGCQPSAQIIHVACCKALTNWHGLWLSLGVLKKGQVKVGPKRWGFFLVSQGKTSRFNSRFSLIL